MADNDDDTVNTGKDSNTTNIKNDNGILPIPPEKKPKKKLVDMLAKVFESPAPPAPEEIERQRIIDKQHFYELFEINESFKFVFGMEKPNKYKECLEISNITLSRIWMEMNFIFEEIKIYKPDEMFWDISKYCLLWQPPESTFKICIPLNSPQLLDQTLREYNNLSLTSKSITIFHFMTIDATMNLFAPRVHPASLVSFYTKKDVLEKLCEFYLEGKIPIFDMNQVMEYGFDTWKKTLYNTLPADWQPYHRYLIQDKIKDDEKIPENMYLLDGITLQVYHDLIFPERARLRLLENAEYPLPYSYEKCIICQNPNNGLIKCQNCDNLVCENCIRKVFLEEITKEGAFLLMHRRYCMNFGAFPNVLSLSLPEPAYLRNIRNSGQNKAMKELMIIPEPDTEEDEGDLDKDVGPSDSEKEGKRLAELNRIDESVVTRRDNFNNRIKRFKHIEKEIIENQSKIDEPGHSDPYYERMQRLNHENNIKLLKLKKQLLKLIEDVELCGEVLIERIGRANGITELQNDVQNLMNRIDILKCIHQDHYENDNFYNNTYNNHNNINNNDQKKISGVYWYEHYWEEPAELDQDEQDPVLALC